MSAAKPMLIWAPIANLAKWRRVGKPALYWRHAYTTNTTDWMNRDIRLNDQYVNF